MAVIIPHTLNISLLKDIFYTQIKDNKIYNKYKDDDGFLYITVALENTFGTFFTVSTIANGLFDQILKSSAKLSRTVGLNNLV